MNTFALVWKNITQQWGAALLSILLTLFGIAILTVIYISADTFEKQLDNNSKNIDLVVGAKGSPLQLILSTLYHVDNPTGNISLEAANKIAQNPFIKRAVPISLGDNFKGHRIIGTDTSYLSLYNLRLADGSLWRKSFQIVIGSEVARKHQLKIGQQIFSAHGLSAEAHVHDDHPFTVVGILHQSNSVVDNLILCNLASVWDVHGIAHSDEHLHDHDHGHNHNHADDGDAHGHYGHDHEEHNHTPPVSDSQSHDSTHHVADHDHQHEGHVHAQDSMQTSDTLHVPVTKQSNIPNEELIVSEKPQNEEFIKRIGQDMLTDHGVEITALLIQYASPSAISVIPRMINQDTEMQAASPAIESSRIFSLLGVGLDSLAVLAYVIMAIAALSIFISLYNALKDRKYDMAIMRTMGASKTKLFTLVLVEGIVITSIGGIIGLATGHLLLYFISTQTSESADFIHAFVFYPNEGWIFLGAIILGLFAALIPAFKAYNTTISKTLASK